MKKLSLVFFIAIALMACSKKVEVATVANSKWTLSEWPGKTLPTTAQATLNFDSSGKIGGKSFCNSYGGNSTISNGTVKFEQLIGTKMFCEAVSQAENNYLADLQAVNAIDMKGDQLQLLKDGEVKMVFARRAE